MNKPAHRPIDLQKDSTAALRSTGPRIPVSAIILTLNEELNIARCLACLKRIDEVILVDSGSTDHTLAIAQEVSPDLRSFQHSFQDFGDQRNWAIDHTDPKHEWLLFVDADEFCTPELLDEIDAFVRSPGSHVGAFIAGKNYFLGRWLKHATHYPSYQLRLFQHGQVRFQKEGHGQREVTSGALYYLQEYWVHEPFSKGIYEWISRHNRYSSDEVELINELKLGPVYWDHFVSMDPIKRRRALKRLAAKIPFRPVLRFAYIYLFKRGFLDGYSGLIYCALLMAHNINIVAKLAESTHVNNDLLDRTTARAAS